MVENAESDSDSSDKNSKSGSGSNSEHTFAHHYDSDYQNNNYLEVDQPTKPSRGRGRPSNQ